MIQKMICMHGMITMKFPVYKKSQKMFSKKKTVANNVITTILSKNVPFFVL